jgi:hypothetical protein
MEKELIQRILELSGVEEEFLLENISIIINKDISDEEFKTIWNRLDETFILRLDPYLKENEYLNLKISKAIKKNIEENKSSIIYYKNIIRETLRSFIKQSYSLINEENRRATIELTKDKSIFAFLFYFLNLYILERESYNYSNNNIPFKKLYILFPSEALKSRVRTFLIKNRENSNQEKEEFLAFFNRLENTKEELYNFIIYEIRRDLLNEVEMDSFLRKIGKEVTELDDLSAEDA